MTTFYNLDPQLPYKRLKPKYKQIIISFSESLLRDKKIITINCFLFVFLHHKNGVLNSVLRFILSFLAVNAYL